MGENPSRFKDPERPVEEVSSNCVDTFLEKSIELSRAKGLRLATEVEWEYACRAGTTDATYAGPMEILGERNVPVLDTIAWYPGNSGINYDLVEGEDSSKWVEKQYPHLLAGTRKVGTRRPNQWGLYDMLGNVWEWCLDTLDNDFRFLTYSSCRLQNPYQYDSGHPFRVIRGGGWENHPQNTRVAYRYAFLREDHLDDLGFRMAMGDLQK